MHQVCGPTEHVSCVSVTQPGWLDTGTPRAWHSVGCVMFIPDIWLSLHPTRPAGSLTKLVLVFCPTWPYLAAVWRRHLSPSLLASLSRAPVFSTSHRTVSCRPHWNTTNSQLGKHLSLGKVALMSPRQKSGMVQKREGSHLEFINDLRGENRSFKGPKLKLRL